VSGLELGALDRVRVAALRGKGQHLPGCHTAPLARSSRFPARGVARHADEHRIRARVGETLGT
jgi:hypothetical protein